MRRLLPYVLPPAACVALALALAALTPAPPKAGALGSSAPAPDQVDHSSFGKLPLPAPARVVLRWWHANQLNDARSAYALLSSSLRAGVGRRGYAQTLRRATLGFIGKPYVTRTAVHGARASVQTVVVAFGATSPGLAYPLRFPVVCERGQWRLASLSYLMMNARDKAATAPIRSSAPAKRG